MTSHPSLSASYVTVEKINPVPQMEPYALCWCRSGKKFKWCHFRREQQKSANIFEIETRMMAELSEGYCLHPGAAQDPCSPQITMAHTIQRRGGLALIAEDAHVLTFRSTLKMLMEKPRTASPRRIGTRKASVFPGFCNHHDSALFRSIEGERPPLDQESAFLFAFRAMAYESFSKEAQLRCVEIQRELDRGLPFFNQAAIQTHLHAFTSVARHGLRDAEQAKRAFDDRLLSGSRDGFHFAMLRCDRILPILGCGAFHPEFDFAGNTLQRLGKRDVAYDRMTLTVTAYGEETIICFGWIGSNDGPARQLVDSFLAIDEERKADAILRLLLVHSENIYARPSWWDSLEPDVQESLYALAFSGASRARRGKDLALPAQPLLMCRIPEISA